LFMSIIMLARDCIVKSLMQAKALNHRACIMAVVIGQCK
jgi:hypothetical protein